MFAGAPLQQLVAGQYQCCGQRIAREPCRLQAVRQRLVFGQPARELGRTAVSLMLRLLNGEENVPAETRLPVTWIGRDSIRSRQD